MTALIETWKDAKELSNEAMSDPGFAEANQEKYMESMEAKLQVLSTEAQSFWNTFLNTDLITGMVSAVTSLFDGFNTLLTSVRSVSDFIPFINGGLAQTVVLVGSIVTAVKLIESISKTGSLVKTIQNIGNDASSLAANLISFKDKFKEGFGAGKGIFASINGGLNEGFKAIGLEGMGAKIAKLGVYGLAVGAAFETAKWAVDKFTDTTEEAAEKAADVNAKYKESQNVLKNTKSSIDSFGQEFEDLSRGVNSSGENISLTTAEYERYHDICNQIADMFPNLVASYDAQGNAILNLKGNLQELNDEYERTRIAAARERIGDSESMESIEKDFNNKTGNQSWGDRLISNITNGFGKQELGGAIDYDKGVSALKDFVSLNYDDAMSKLKEVDNPVMSYFNSAYGFNQSTTAEEFESIRSLMVSDLNVAESEIAAATASMRSRLQDYVDVFNADQYHLDDSVMKNLSSLISNMSEEQIKSLEDNGITLEQYATDLLDRFKDPESQNALSNLFNLDDVNIEDLQSVIDRNVRILAEKSGKDPVQIKAELNLDDNEYQKAADSYSKILSNNAVNQSLTNRFGEYEGNYNVKKETSDKIYDDLRNISLLNDPNYIDDGKIKKTLSQLEDDYRTQLSNVADQIQVKSNGKDNKNRIDVVINPVDKDGNSLEGDDLDNYISKYFETGVDEKGIVLKKFDSSNTNWKDITKESKKYASNVKNAIKYSKNENKELQKLNKFLKANNLKTADQLDLVNRMLDKYGEVDKLIKNWGTEELNIGINTSKLEELESNLAKVEEAIQKTNQAVKDSHSSSGLNKEDINNIKSIYEEVEGYNYDKLFENTYGGIKLNIKALQELRENYSKQEYEKYTNELSDLEEQYKNTCRAIGEMADGSPQKNSLIAQKNSLLDQIHEAEALQSRYEGLTNAVAMWQEAQSSGEKGDVYESIRSGLKEAKEQYTNGWIGKETFQAYTKMFTGSDVDTSKWDSRDYEAQFKKQESRMDRWLAEERQGAFNFVEDINSAFGGMYDAAGNVDWSKMPSVKEIADKFDVSTSLIENMFDVMNAAGADLDYTEDGERLRALKNEAINSYDQLDARYKNKLNLDISDEGSLDTIDKVDEKLKTVQEDLKGLETRREHGDTTEETANAIRDLEKVEEYLTTIKGEMSDWTVDIHSTEGINKLKEEVIDLEGSLKTALNDDNYSLDIDWGNNDPQYIQERIDEVQGAVQSLTNEDGTINLSAEDLEKANDILTGLIQKKVELNQPAIMQIDTSSLSESEPAGLASVQNIQKAINDLEVTKQLTLNTDGAEQKIKDAEDKVKAAIDQASQDAPTLMTDLGLKDGSVAEVQQKIKDIDGKVMLDAGFSEEALAGIQELKVPDSTVKVDADTTAADQSIAAIDENLSVERKLNVAAPQLYSIKATYDAIRDKNVAISVTKTITEVTQKANGTAHASGTAHVSGTAHASGTAFASGTARASGNWGAPKTETALVGELGTELLRL